MFVWAIDGLLTNSAIFFEKRIKHCPSLPTPVYTKPTFFSRVANKDSFALKLLAPCFCWCVIPDLANMILSFDFSFHRWHLPLPYILSYPELHGPNQALTWTKDFISILW